MLPKQRAVGSIPIAHHLLSKQRVVITSLGVGVPYVNQAKLLCVPAIKANLTPPPGPVGGIAEVLVDSSHSTASPADGSGSSSLLYAALAGAVAAGAFALAIGGWYARRRFRQRRIRPRRKLR